MAKTITQEITTSGAFRLLIQFGLFAVLAISLTLMTHRPAVVDRDGNIVQAEQGNKIVGNVGSAASSVVESTTLSVRRIVSGIRANSSFLFWPIVGFALGVLLMNAVPDGPWERVVLAVSILLLIMVSGGKSLPVSAPRAESAWYNIFE